jgi:hypothetical protein
MNDIMRIDSVFLQDLARKLGRSWTAIERDVRRLHIRTHMAPPPNGGNWLLAITAPDCEAYLQNRRDRGLDKPPRRLNGKKQRPPRPTLVGTAIKSEVRMPLY